MFGPWAIIISRFSLNLSVLKYNSLLFQPLDWSWQIYDCAIPVFDWVFYAGDSNEHTILRVKGTAEVPMINGILLNANFYLKPERMMILMR